MSEPPEYLKKDECPACLYEIECATAIGAPARPKSGDFTICLNCGAIMVYEENLDVRLASDLDLERADPESRRTFDRARALIAQRGPISNQRQSFSEPPGLSPSHSGECDTFNTPAARSLVMNADQSADVACRLRHLLNRSAVRDALLDAAANTKRMSNGEPRFTRVSDACLDSLEAHLMSLVRVKVSQLTANGRTIR